MSDRENLLRLLTSAGIRYVEHPKDGRGRVVVEVVNTCMRGPTGYYTLFTFWGDRLESVSAHEGDS